MLTFSNTQFYSLLAGVMLFCISIIAFYLRDDRAENKKEHDEFFKRVREIELRNEKLYAEHNKNHKG